MKTMFRAILSVNGKENVFAKSSDSVSGLKKLLGEHGMSLSNVKRIETFEQTVEKQRGRAPRKY